MKNTTNKQDIEEIADFSIRLGNLCWDVFSKSKPGRLVVAAWDSKESAQHAYRLFQHGFSIRMLLPPQDKAEFGFPRFLESGHRAWKEFPDAQKDRTEPTYDRMLFLEGFRAGTIAVREILKIDQVNET